MNQLAIHLVIGVSTPDLLLARLNIEAIVGVSLIEHESTYRCGVYFRGNLPSGAELVLQVNEDPFDAEPLYETDEKFPIVLFVSAHQEPSEILARLHEIGGLIEKT